MRSVPIIVCFFLPALSGCGSDGLPSKVVHGTITFNGEKVMLGQVRFVPIEGTPGPASFSSIEDGKYRIEARGGVPVGKHRVEVQAKKKTGRQRKGHGGTEIAMVDEVVRVGPPIYGSPKSPLLVEVTKEGDGQIDLELKP